MKSEENKNEDPIMNEPLTELVLTMSAWRRLWAEAKEFGNKEPMIGLFVMMLMEKAKREARKDMKDDEKELINKFKKAME